MCRSESLAPSASTRPTAAASGGARRTSSAARTAARPRPDAEPGGQPRPRPSPDRSRCSIPAQRRHLPVRQPGHRLADRSGQPYGGVEVQVARPPEGWTRHRLRPPGEGRSSARVREPSARHSRLASEGGLRRTRQVRRRETRRLAEDLALEVLAGRLVPSGTALGRHHVSARAGGSPVPSRRRGCRRAGP